MGFCALLINGGLVRRHKGIVKLQNIFVFEGRKFWSNKLDIEKLNEKILELNASGWVVKSVSPSFSILGMNRSYTILMESPG